MSTPTPEQPAPDVLTATRRRLATLLEATGVTVVPFVPETLPTPCVIVEPADDYLSAADTYDLDEWWLTVNVFALVDLIDNQAATEDLDALLTRLVPALRGTDWELAAVSKPAPWHTSQWLAHGVRLTVRNLVHLTTTTTQETP